MKVGFVGCGKLGLMVALAIESKGHEVKGHDINPAVAGYLKDRTIPFQEEDSGPLLEATKIEMVALEELCQWADILFLAPQTPHAPRFEGATRLPRDRADFDYQYLKQCVKDVSGALTSQKTCVLISTVLPGTLEREVIPLLSSNFKLVYEPLFIAMGTVVRDFLNPEFILIGGYDWEAADQLIKFYDTLGMHDKVFVTDVRTAEGIKVFYNTFITAKTVLANMYGEMAHRLGMNVDDIYYAICRSTDRLLSPKYLKAGMGDGGGCHPRDNIALSYIADQIGLSFNLFDALMKAREAHTDFLADLIEEHRGALPVFILGRSFKPETNIETGSPAVLLSNILKERGIDHECSDGLVPEKTGLYFIGTKHERYRFMRFPKDSVVIDPFRYVGDLQAAVRVISVGNAKHESEYAEIP